MFKDNVISVLELEDKEFSTLIYKIIIFTENDNFYFIKSTNEKLKEVANMPEYIKKDWLSENKEEVNLIILNNQIKFKKEMLDVLTYGTKEAYELEKEIKKLITLRSYIISNGKI